MSWILVAHGVQGRAETPIPISAFFWSAGIVLVVSFIALALGWKRPMISSIPWRRAPRWVEAIVLSATMLWLARIATLLSTVFVTYAALVGSTLLSKNIAPITVFVVWWVGLVPVSALLGNIWRSINPWVTLAVLFRFPASRANRPYPSWLGLWPSVIFLLLFGWLELVYTTPAQPRLIGTIIVLYSLITVAAMYRWGYRSWLDNGEVFSVYTGVLAYVSPVETRRVHGDLQLGFRPPIVAVTRLAPRPATVGFISVLLATVTFDGLSGSSFWQERDVAAAERLINVGVAAFPAGIIVATLGIITTLAVIVAMYEGASWLSAWSARWPNVTSVGRMAVAFIHTLIPIALAYFIAHYFTLFVFQGQDLVRLISDPLGSGRDYFGTANFRINFQAVSANVIWTVQVSAIVIGHVVALALAHDRALQLAATHRDAIRSQWPMLILMVALTVSGLWSLSEGMAGV